MLLVMTRRRDIIILTALFAVLVVFTILGPGQSQDENATGTKMTTHSSEPGGALALLRWLESMGYDARRLQYTAFEPGPRTEALFILNPTQPINRTEAGRVLDWVEAGGTLVLVDDKSQIFAAQNELLTALDVDTRLYEGDEEPLESASVLQPVFHEPPVTTIPLRADRVLVTERDDVAHLVGRSDGTVLMGIQRGQGYIYISSASYPFTNEGLGEDASAALILNLLRQVPRGGQVLFDEYHHGFFEPPSLRGIVLSNPWGWALLYALAVVGLFFILTGRRFGKPIPLREEVALRSSAEYVESMSDLFQRAGKRGYILNHYYIAFKRRLAKPFGINPSLDDQAFVAELARYRDIDQQALLATLNSLQRTNVSEDELLRTVADADKQWSTR
jgi:hypothetical protein